jgi:hypothetical protein
MGQTNFDTDDSKIIQTIQESVKTETLEIGEEVYTTRPVHLPQRRDLAKAIEAHSLTAIVDYLNSNFDNNALPSLAVQVKSPVEVRVRGEIQDPEDRRFTPFSVTADLPQGIHYGQYFDLETAVIYLQSRFVQSETRDELIRNLGNIVATEALTQRDDGMSQEVTMQKGIRREESTIQNPVALAPFRTFAEIPQPESPFIIRLRKPKEEPIQVAFFEADGGAWSNTARLAIKAFLDKALGADNGIPILA